MTNYDFRTLSPLDFELLVRDLFNAEHGSLLASFAPGPDGGVDLRGAAGDWHVVVVQCKHTPDATRSSATRSAEREVAKWSDIAPPDAYFLAISANISPAVESQLKESLKPLPVPADGIWHRGRLNALLSRHLQVEQAHFKLWLASSSALESILSSGQRQRSEELLQRVQDRARFFVFTPAYQNAIRLLQEHNAVVITGPPGSGKSTIAEMLLLTASRDGWSIVDVTANIDEAWARLRQGGKTIFYYDDFLGQTNIAEVGKNEAASIARFLDRVRRGDGSHRLVLTTRDQVLAQAKFGVDDRLRRLDVEPDRSPVVLDDISRLSRAQILFNHMYFAIEGDATRRESALDERYFSVIDHPNFSPRIIESATLRQTYSSLDEMYSTLLAALDNPDELWLGSFHQLSSVASAALMQLATSPRGSMPVTRLRAGLEVPDPRSWDQALKVLEGSWIRLGAGPTGAVRDASLFDPSRRDFLLGLMKNDEYLEQAIDLAVDSDQLEFLVRMSRLGEEQPSSKPERLVERGFAEGLRRFLPRLVQAARECATDELHELAHRKSLGRDGSTPRWPAETSWWRPADHRARIIRRVASIVALSPRADHIDWFCGVLDSFVEACGAGATASTDEMFSLVNALAALADSAAIELSEQIENITVFGLESMENGEDVDRYWMMDDIFKSERVEAAASDAIYQALDSDRDGIRQQSDIEVINSWIEETRERIERHAVPLYLDSLEEWAETVDRRVSERPKLRSLSEAPVSDDADTSDDVAHLFFRMMSGVGDSAEASTQAESEPDS